MKKIIILSSILLSVVGLLYSLRMNIKSEGSLRKKIQTENSPESVKRIRQLKKRINSTESKLLAVIRTRQADEIEPEVDELWGFNLETNVKTLNDLELKAALDTSIAFFHENNFARRVNAGELSQEELEDLKRFHEYINNLRLEEMQRKYNVIKADLEEFDKRVRKLNSKLQKNG